MAQVIKRKPKTETVSLPVEDLATIPSLPKEFSKIILLKKEINPEEEWEIIRAWVSTAPKTVNELRDAIRISADMIARTKDLITYTTKAYNSYKLRYDARMQLWRHEALAYLSNLERKVKKQITEQMIKDHIINNYEADYSSLQERMDDMALLVENFKSLGETVYNKSVDLRKLLDSEGRRPSGPDWMDKK